LPRFAPGTLVPADDKDAEFKRIDLSFEVTVGDYSWIMEGSVVMDVSEAPEADPVDLTCSGSMAGYIARCLLKNGGCKITKTYQGKGEHRHVPEAPLES
jgi:hypothetical protein